MIADDDLPTLSVLNQILTRAHYKVIAVENGQLACDAVRREQPDLALLDWSMPVMNGLTALKSLKSDDATRGIPIIILTSHGFKQEFGAHAGASDFIVKPCAVAELMGRIELQCDRRREALTVLSAATDNKAAARKHKLSASCAVLTAKAASRTRAMVALMVRRAK